jgi:hypothetical protein
MIEITTPVGRLVAGHPMIGHPQTDDKTGQPKLNKDGTPQLQFYMGLAIQKGTEQHWNQTPWGQQIWNEALSSFPNGEHGMAAFSWKITDGDSQIPNKKMKKPCDKEGFPGHWIINASNGFAVSCYRPGKYNPLTDQIQTKEEIKCGDYARLVISAKGNSAVPPNTPGVYLNPTLFELYQPGVAIVSENAPDPMASLGATQGVLPQGAMVDNNVPVAPVAGVAGATPQMPVNAPMPGAVTPAPDILTPTPTPDYMIMMDGQPHSHAALIAAGWREEQLMGLPRA